MGPLIQDMYSESEQSDVTKKQALSAATSTVTPTLIILHIMLVKRRARRALKFLYVSINLGNILMRRNDINKH